MITDDLIRKEFVRRIMHRDATFIYDTQAKVLRDNFTNEMAMKTADFLSKHPFSESGDGNNPIFYFRVFTYLRFLDIKFSSKKDDMKLRGKLALYNRVIWGRLYHETIGDLKYGLTEDIKRDISNRLSKNQK
jgi:hypothetical protein